MVYFEGTDVIGHLFASYVAAEDGVRSEADSPVRHAVDEYYALVDRILGQWMRRAEEDGATLHPQLRPRLQVGRATDRASGGPGCRDGGLLASARRRLRRVGSARAPGPARGSASVFDVPVTVSALLGLPVDRGRPERRFGRRSSASPRRNAGISPAFRVRRLETGGMSEMEASEYAKKLMALGYLSGSEPGRLAPSGGDRPGLTDSAWNNLGLYLCGNPGKVDLAAAEAAYRKALELRPDYDTAMANLAALYSVKGDDRQSIEWTFRSFAAGRPHAEDAILDLAAAYQARGKRREVREVLERGASAYPDSEALNRALALDDYTAKRCPEADRILGRFEGATQSAETLNALALIRVCLGRRDDAVRLFQRSLALRPDQPTVVQSLAVLAGEPSRKQGS